MTTNTLPDADHYQAAPMLNDRRNITVGTTRVIYAPATGPHFEGWVLLGGLRTQDRGRAMAHAVQMEALVQGVAPSKTEQKGWL